MKVLLLLSTVLLAVHLGRSTPVGTCPANNPPVDVRLPDSDNCAIFYKCDWGTPVLMDCPATLAFNAITSDCDYPENVDCDRNNIVDGDITDGGVGGTGPLVECPTDSIYATYIPDKTDCTVYYVCNFGNPIAQKCPAGLYYDGTIWACTYQEQATCFTYRPIEIDDGNNNNGGETPGGGAGGPVGTCPVQSEEDVLLPDAENCGIFYLCDAGVPVAMDCPAGLNFNTDTNQCDYPENVNCDRTSGGNGDSGGDGGSSGNGGGPLIECPADGVYLPDKTDCSIYYVCAYGTAIAQQCPAGLYYDGTIWACTYQDQATCFTYRPLEDENDNGGQPPVGGEAGGPVGTCPVQSEEDVLLPDSENCGIFYLCDAGVPVAMDCPAGLNFNTDTNQCDYPENVNCDRTSGGSGGSGGDGGSGGNGGGNGGGPLIECPADGVYLPDKTDCSIYYVCAYGTAIAQQCPAGLYYDGTIWACTYQDQATCFTYLPLEDNNGNGGQPPVGGEAGGPVGSCPAESDVDVLLPDAENCAIFYKCDAGVPVVMDCPAGLYFNTDNNQCDFPENVNCDRTSAGNGSTGGDNNGNGAGSGPLISCPGDGIYLPDKTDCSIYYICVYGNAIQQQCPAGLYYDGTIWACTYQNEAVCYTYAPQEENVDGEQPGGVQGSGPIGTCPAENTIPDTLLPDEENCAIFYKCNWGEPVLMECPDNLLFNTVNEQCDYAENVNCDRDVNVGPGEIVSPPSEGDSGEQLWVGECPAQSVTDVYLPSRYDPHKFYVCVGTTPVEQVCPANLVFNLALQQCDYA